MTIEVTARVIAGVRSSSKGHKDAIMAGRDNKLAGQIGEYLVCAELGRRGLIATPFAGNVPNFDVLAADEQCRTVPIQVKASRSNNWPAQATDWMEIELDAETGVQLYQGPKAITNPDLIYVCVAIAEVGQGRDRFFILTKAQVQQAIIAGYSEWMKKHGWKRPRNTSSFDCRYFIPSIAQYEDNWQLIMQRLEGRPTDNADSENADKVPRLDLDTARNSASEPLVGQTSVASHSSPIESSPEEFPNLEFLDGSTFLNEVAESQTGAPEIDGASVSTQSADGLKHRSPYNREFFEQEHGHAATKAFMQAVAQIEDLALRNQWPLQIKFNKYHLGFMYGGAKPFGVSWSSKQSWYVHVRVKKEIASRFHCENWRFHRFDPGWNLALFYPVNVRADAQELEALYAMAYKDCTGS